MGAFDCTTCDASFTRRWDLKRHTSRFHTSQRIMYKCTFCNRYYRTVPDLREHRETHVANETFSVHNSAFNRTCIVYRKTYDDNARSLEELFANEKRELKNIMALEIAIKKVIRANIVISFEFVKLNVNEEGVEDAISIPMRAKGKRLIGNDDLEQFIDESFAEIDTRFDDFQEKGSDWILDHIEYSELEVGKCRDLAGGCGDLISVKKLKDIDDLFIRESNQINCFLEAIAFHFIDSTDKNDLKNFIDEYINMDGLSLPMKIRDIKKFEKQNEHLKCRISVITCEDEKIFPIYCSKYIQFEQSIVLYYAASYDDRRQIAMGHYFHVECLNNFLKKEYEVPTRGRTYYENLIICHNCFNRFTSKSAMRMHSTQCLKSDPQTKRLPWAYPLLTFTHHYNKFLVPIIGFYDFECIPINTPHACQKCKKDQDECKHNTTEKSTQQPVSYSLMFITRDGEIIHQSTYIGDNVIDHFMNELLLIEPKLVKILNKFPDLNMTDSEEALFMSQTECHICEKEFVVDALHKKTNKRVLKVRDHCHITGKFIGAAHRACNLSRREKDARFVLYAHNSSAYDLHLILKHMKSDERIKCTTALPKNMEKLRCLEINNYRFYDSYCLLGDSLDRLVKNLVLSKHKFNILKKCKIAENKNQFQLLLRKGVFPYEHFNSAHAMKNSGYPAIEAFHSALTNSDISQAEYDYGRSVYDSFNCQSMLDYLQLYNETDVALLAEVVIHFRGIIHDEFKLDVCRYLSLPSVGYDCFLKYTNVEIELITDIDMYQFVQRGIRGGLSFIADRYANMSDKTYTYEHESNAWQEENVNGPESIVYIDANNLYGHAMSNPLPIGDYEWLHERYFYAIDWTSTCIDSDKGFILEVDLEYPEHLHKAHNSFPLAPESARIDYDMLSQYNKKCKQLLNKTERHQSRKLVSTLSERKNYVLNYNTLRLYLSLGMKLKKIHKVLLFTQEAYMKPYIDLCTRKRKESLSVTFKNIFKLLNNACFGKLLQDVSKYLNVKIFLRRDTDKIMKYLSKPTCTGFQIVSDDLVLAYSIRASVALRQPIAAGMCVLEMSKYFMFDNYYNYITKNLGDDCRVLMTDTDSFIIASHNSNDEVFQKLKSRMDFSNYPITHPLYSERNKNKLGFWKDEMQNNVITEFVGIRSKVYALKSTAGFDSKIKGVKKSYKRDVTFNAFVSAVQHIKQHRVSQYSFRSRNHVISLLRQNRIAFQSLDDKRYLFNCGIHSVPYGSKYCKRENDCMLCKKYAHQCVFSKNIVL